ncbi:hypothetical protein ABEY43_06120 [Priestia megaterium]
MSAIKEDIYFVYPENKKIYKGRAKESADIFGSWTLVQSDDLVKDGLVEANTVWTSEGGQFIGKTKEEAQKLWDDWYMGDHLSMKISSKVYKEWHNEEVKHGDVFEADDYKWGCIHVPLIIDDEVDCEYLYVYEDGIERIFKDGSSERIRCEK